MNEETTIEERLKKERECLGDCFKCSHHNVIEKQCRITGVFCKYPTKNCQNKDYPWGK